MFFYHKSITLCAIWVISEAEEKSPTIEIIGKNSLIYDFERRIIYFGWFQYAAIVCCRQILQTIGSICSRGR